MIRRLAAALLLLPLAAFAGPPPRAPLFIQPESRLWVEGATTDRTFRCAASRIEGRIATVPERPGTGLAALEAAVRRVEVAVPVAALECGNPTLSRQVREALGAGTSPLVRYRVTSHRLAAGSDSEATLRMNGALSIAGRENPVGIDAAVVRGPGGALRVRGTKWIRMSEFGVEPPTLMMGTIRVQDRVTVHFDVVLKP
ncbi:MAG TPA: YceI family protein [Longimicrobiaceae bacterium]